MAHEQQDILDEQRSVLRPLVLSRLLLATLFLLASILVGGQHHPFYVSMGLFFLVTALSLVMRQA